MIFGCGNSQSNVGSKEVEQTNESLSIWVSSFENDDYEDVFDTYRSLYPDVDLNITVYDDNNYTSEKATMNTQLMAGEGPDLLFLGIYGIENVDKMMQSGIFASMSGYMDKDETFDEDDYVKSVMDTGIYNGEQYVFPLEYSSTIFISSQEALAEQGISEYEYDDYFSFMEMLTSLYDKKTTGRILCDCGAFSVINDMGIEALDYENKKVNIDTDDVKYAFELYKKAYEEDTTPGTFDYGESILDRTAVFRRTASLEDTYRVLATIAQKETPVILPLKTVDGKISAAIKNSLAVRANSANKENAWKMIKLLLEAEGENILSDGGTPVCKEGITKAIESAKESVDMDVALETMEEYTIPEETLKTFEDAVTNVEMSYFFTSALGLEMSNRMEPYLKGEDSYENCMKDYVSFADIYISE